MDLRIIVLNKMVNKMINWELFLEEKRKIIKNQNSKIF